jgi:sugar/nucleoside kinase (ribokinase family)
MNNGKKYDVVCIGNYTKDTIVSPAGTTFVDGGAMNYSAFAAASLGLKVAVVTRLSEDDRRVVEALVKAGIDCYPTYTPHSTCMRLEYPTTSPDIRTLSVTHTAGSIAPSDLDGVQMNTAILGSSLRGEIEPGVFADLKRRGIRVAADVQGFVRVLRGTTLENEPWDEMAATLNLVDILKSDAVEAEFLTGEADIHRAAQAFAKMGPREIVLTHKDGLLVYAEGQYHELAFHASRMDGRSGRGDTCIGAYAGLRLTRSAADAARGAAAITSLKMERLGPFRRHISEVNALLREEYGGTLAI